MAWYEKVYQYEDEVFQAGNQEDITRLIERLVDRELVMEQNGEYYLRMDPEDILDSLAEMGEIESETSDSGMAEMWE